MVVLVNSHRFKAQRLAYSALAQVSQPRPSIFCRPFGAGLAMRKTNRVLTPPGYMPPSLRDLIPCISAPRPLLRPVLAPGARQSIASTSAAPFWRPAPSPVLVAPLFGCQAADAAKACSRGREPTVEIRFDYKAPEGRHNPPSHFLSALRGWSCQAQHKPGADATRLHAAVPAGLTLCYSGPAR